MKGTQAMTSGEARPPEFDTSSSAARARVDTQNATSARSRCDPSAANSSLNFSSEMRPQRPPGESLGR